MYVRAYDNVIDSRLCQTLIEKFNQTEQLERDNECFNFNEININQTDLFSEEVSFLAPLLAGYVPRYKNDIGIPDALFPSDYGLEEFRMKMYEPNKGKFSPHIDSINKETSKRFLVMFLYLDEGEGGETFIVDGYNKIEVKRKPGRLLIFPPFFTFPHEGRMPIGNRKHIVGTYLHYV